MAYKSKEEQKAAHRAYYLRNKEKIKAKAAAWRKANPERAAEAVRQWCERNPERDKALHKAYYEKHAEKLKARSREYHHAHKVLKRKREPVGHNASCRAYRERNRDRIVEKSRERYKQNASAICAYLKARRDQNRDKWLAWSRDYRKRNQHKRNAAHAARRAVKANVPVGEREQIQLLYRWVRTAPLVLCHHCGQPVPKNKRHVDHLVALKAGGAHTLANLVPSCERCNCRKGARPVEALRTLPSVTASSAAAAPGGCPDGSSRLPLPEPAPASS